MKKEIGLYELVLLFSYTATEKEIVERVEYYRDSLLKKGNLINQLQTEIKRDKNILRSLTTKLNDQKVDEILSQTL